MSSWKDSPLLKQTPLVALFVVPLILSLIAAQTVPINTFKEVTSRLTLLRDYQFGTRHAANIRNLSRLAQLFEPYGLSGKTVINQEWERYQPFNEHNFVFAHDALEINATIPDRGGCFPGGINSGQIWTKELFTPVKTGYTEYAFQVRMRVPPQRGAWPAAWLYTKEPGKDDGSEIDNPEFFNMKNQNSYDWTGFQHGPGQGAELYSIKTNKFVWHPGIDFAADYHTYELHWTESMVSKFVDEKLIYSQMFKWTAPGAAQFGVNLAVGSNSPSLPGLAPESIAEFPIKLSVSSIRVWAK